MATRVGVNGEPVGVKEGVDWPRVSGPCAAEDSARLEEAAAGPPHGEADEAIVVGAAAVG